MKIQYLGHSAFYVETAEMKALIDPFLRGNPQATKQPQDFEELTHIFVTHGHADHLGDTLELAKQTGATVFCNFEIANYLQKKGLEKVHAMHLGGRFQQIKMTPALHGSSIEEGDALLEAGNPCGFLIESGGVRLYHAGDTGLDMNMQLLKGQVDVALLPVGGNYTMDWEDAQCALSFIEPKIFIPMHYNTFELIALSEDQMEHRAPCEMKILLPGQEVEIG